VLDAAAAAVEVAGDGADVVLLVGDHDLDLHGGLEQGRLGLLGGFLEGHGAGDLEGHFAGINLVVGAVEERDLDVAHGIAGEHAAFERLLDALLDRLDELLGDRAADDVVLEDEAGAGGAGLDGDLDVAVLAAAAGLADVLALGLGFGADGLAVGDLGLADVGLDAELAHHAVHQDLEVELAHAADDGLAGLGVGVDAEGGIFLGELGQGLAHLLLVALGLGLDGDVNDRGGELDGLEQDGVVLVADGVAGGDGLEADAGGDVAGPDLADLLALVGVHLQQAADALALLLGGVPDGGAGFQPAAVDADEGELADEGVGHDLEDEAAEGGVVLGLAGELGGVAVGIGGGLGVEAPDAGDIQGRRQIGDDGVEQGLDALVLEGGAAHHREELHGDDRAAEGGAQLVGGEGLAVHVLLEQGVVALDDLLDHLLAVVVGDLGHLGGDGSGVVGGAQGFIAVGDGLHGHQVHDAAEAVFVADGDLDGDGGGVEAGADGAEGVGEVGAGAVHLVDEADAGDAVLVGLAPDGLGLGLDAVDAIEEGDGAVEDAEGALDLGGEVHVAGGIDDVDADVVPEAGGGGAGDGDAALLLLLHPVHDGGAFVHLAQAVGLAGVIEDALGGGGLAGINVGHDADVPSAGEGCAAGHEGG